MTSEEERKQQIELFKQCIEDAEKIIAERNLKGYQTDIISIATSLFEKRTN